jgi:hypothetical protein
MMRAISLRTLDGYDISAVLTAADLPDIAIWMHGISVDKDEYLGLFRDGAQWLASKGIASVRFDFRGHGESSGNSLDFSVIGQNLDAEAVLEYIKRESTGQVRMHIIGASFGAPPALFAAARHPQDIHSVSLISPVLSYWRTFLEPETQWAKELFSEDRLRRLATTGRLHIDGEFYIGPRLVEEMRVIRPASVLGELTQRVLAIHGDRDSMVPYDATYQACRGLQHVMLVTLPGADHGFVQGGDDAGVTQQSIENKEAIFRRLEEHIRAA